MYQLCTGDGFPDRPLCGFGDPYRRCTGTRRLMFWKNQRELLFSAFHLPLMTWPFPQRMSTRGAVSTGRLLSFLIAGGLACVGVEAAIADIVSIHPVKDNTLYQYDPAEGDLSNARGLHFFAGETALGELRRGVLAFDIAGNVPAGSTITSVSLTLNMSRTPGSTPRAIELHVLLADWGEGTSQASGEEGQGAPATPNDATWRHRFYDTIFWAAPGGDFSPVASASQLVGDVGLYTWSSPQMAADVQLWLDNPGANFGWLVLGDESEIATTKRFDTRESNSPPVLTIEYIAPRATPTPRPRPTPRARPTPVS